MNAFAEITAASRPVRVVGAGGWEYLSLSIGLPNVYCLYTSVGCSMAVPAIVTFFLSIYLAYSLCGDKS